MISLKAVPAPTSPQRRMLSGEPIWTRRDDFTLLNNAGLFVPTMKVRVPASEPIGPPEMGASRKFVFGRLEQASATDFMEATARVPHSISVLVLDELLERIPARTPVCGSRYTASRAGSDGRTVMSVS